MIMPKLELPIGQIKNFYTKEELEKFFVTLKEEQGLEFEMSILLLALIHDDFVKGFCFAYFLIREALIKKSTDSLENIVK